MPNPHNLETRIEFIDAVRAKWVFDNLEKIPPKKKGKRAEEARDQYRKWYEDFLKRGKANGDISVGYYRKYQKERPKGRRICQGSKGLQMMDRRYRHIICKDYYLDVDICNCHPTILQQICATFGWECPVLRYYNTNRKNLMKELTEKNPDLDDEDVKHVIMCVINGGYDGYHTLTVKPDWLVAFYDEMKKIRQAICSDMTDAFEFCKEKKESKGEKWNVDGSTIARVLQEYEDEILDVMVKFFESKGLTVSVLCFDGCMIKLDSKAKDLVDSSLLKECCDKIYSETEFVIDLKIKPFDEGVEIPEKELKSIQDQLETQSQQSKLSKTHSKRSTKADTNDESRGADSFNAAYEEFFNSRDIKIIDHEIYLKNGNLWTNDERYIKAIIAQSGIIVKGKSVDCYAHCDGFYKGLSCYAQLRESEKLWDVVIKSMGKVFYRNGYYDMAKKEFVVSDDATLVRIERDYNPENYRDFSLDHPKVKGVIEKLFSCLGNEKQLEFAFQQFSRAIGGHIWDKNWFIMTGLRNSGKGSVQKAFFRVFGAYITSVSPPMVGDFPDPAMAYRWILTSRCYLARMGFSNESLSSKSAKPTIDGNAIKGSTGGDLFPARKMRENEVMVRNNCTFFFSFNDIPPTNPPDALKTCRAIYYPFSYGDADPEFNIRQAEDLKDYIENDEDLVYVTEWLIYHFYGEHIPDKDVPDFSKCYKEQVIMEDKPTDKASIFKRLFKKTEGAQIPKEDVLSAFKEFDKNVTMTSLTQWLNSVGYKDTRINVYADYEDLSGQKIKKRSKLAVYLGFSKKVEEAEE